MVDEFTGFGDGVVVVRRREELVGMPMERLVEGEDCGGGLTTRDQRQGLAPLPA